MAISYQATEWKSGDVLTATQLNNIENGIKTLAGSSNVSEDHNVTRHLSVATTWSRNGETQVPTVNSENIVMSADDTNGVIINRPTTINNTATITGDTTIGGTATISGALTVGSSTTASSATIHGNTTITGNVEIDGAFKIKNGDNIVLEKNSEVPSTIHIPNYLVVGKATAGNNSTVNYEGNVTFNTATNYIHGNTRIENLAVDNKINGLTIGNITSDTITNSGDFTVGTATTTTVADEEVTTYSGEAVFNTTKLTAHGNTIVDTLKTIDNANIEGVLTVGTASANKQFNVYGGTTITGSATIGGSNTLINLQGITNITDLHTNGPAYLQSLIVGSVGVDLGTPSIIYTDLQVGNSSVSKNVTIYGAANINSLTLSAAENSLIVGTAEVNNDGNITQATGQTILHGTTTIDDLVIGTAEIKEIGENNEEQITHQATGSAVLHGSVQIDNLHADQLVSGTPPEYNELNEMTKEPEGSTTLYGTTIVNALQAETLDVDIFNGVEVPSLPIDEDSTEEVKPYKDGIYTLQLTITNGEPSYSWVAIGGAEP